MINFKGIGSLRKELQSHGTLNTLQLIKFYIENNKNKIGDKKQVRYCQATGTGPGPGIGYWDWGWENGKMGKWKNGKMEKWKNRKMENGNGKMGNREYPQSQEMTV